NNANIYKDRGDIYSNIGKNKEAIEDYSRAIQINPNYAEAYLARGMANDDDLKQSIEDCETALRLNLDKRLIESTMGFLEARKNKLLAKNQLEQN
ncbi:MAG: tetratricopeptide repeat protein, partial [Treponema sp.]|nr:tetratricopeptide repeat protein [Treponema sp.]